MKLTDTKRGVSMCQYFTVRFFGGKGSKNIWNEQETTRIMEANKIVVYQTEDGQTQIDVWLENDAVWPLRLRGHIN